MYPFADQNIKKTSAPSSSSSIGRIFGTIKRTSPKDDPAIGAPVLVSYSSVDGNLAPISGQASANFSVASSRSSIDSNEKKTPPPRGSSMKAHHAPQHHLTPTPAAAAAAAGVSPLQPYLSKDGATTELRANAVTGLKRSNTSVKRLSGLPDQRRSNLQLPQEYLDRLSQVNKPIYSDPSQLEPIKESSSSKAVDSDALSNLTRLGRSATTSSVKSPTPAAKAVTINIFLQNGWKVNKVKMVEGQISVARLREKFSTTFQQHLPEGEEPGIPPKLYIKDPVAQVFYELEDLNDVKENSVIRIGKEVNKMLKVEEQLDQRFSALSKDLMQLRSLVVERTSATTMTAHNETVDDDLQRQVRSMQQEIRTLRGELGGLRQIHAEFCYESQQIIKKLLQQQQFLRDKKGKGIAKRTAISENIGIMDEKTEAIANRLDELHDLVADLKGDITSRGAKPSELRMKLIRESLNETGNNLTVLSDQVARFTPEWKKLWEADLVEISNEQDFLVDQQQLLEDLEKDQHSLSAVFSQIEKIVQLQEDPDKKEEKNIPELDVHSADDVMDEISNVFAEINCVVPDSEKRLKAAERAERIRKWEKEHFEDDFQQELNTFLSQGKLASKGGVDEVERRMEAKRQAAIEAALKSSDS